MQVSGDEFAIFTEVRTHFLPQMHDRAVMESIKAHQYLIFPATDQLRANGADQLAKSLHPNPVTQASFLRFAVEINNTWPFFTETGYFCAFHGFPCHGFWPDHTY